ncbi:putative Dimeric alpha-beta barrel protein [Vibrio nigripulchritudo SOn1]|uniref:Dimeric alpha-beta barrel protein n=1 Tax=Vibrio nigripulchritudo SOn1 TaxID=1238450 RepID=A0AAV2VZA7_9VIBR|nr:hypothetical protein [Vibrio nigripulchritudo]CCO49937.1 putative Dimeric alpha-beta barrel protein [Vibrio nigripulchritudo SOn1]
MKNANSVIETVTWRVNEGVSEEEMKSAVELMLLDLKNLPGFIHETLSVNETGQWLQLYYWETAEDAHNSNQLMADKPSFAKLIALIQPDSVDIQVYRSIHASSAIRFD